MGDENYDIRRLANFIQRKLAYYTLRRIKGILPAASEAVIKDNPEVDYLKNSVTLSDALTQRLQQALILARQCEALADIVDGAYGEEYFCILFEKAMEEAKRADGVR